MSHHSIHADTPKVVYLYEDVPKEALKSASARLKGSSASRFSTTSGSSSAKITMNSSSRDDESSFVYPANDLSANIEKADGFYDSSWKPLKAGEDVTMVKEKEMSGRDSSNAIPVATDHHRTSSWITMDSDGHPAQATIIPSVYTPTASYHSPSPSSVSVPLPRQESPTAPPAQATESEDPWSAWTSESTKVTGEDAYLSRKSNTSAKSPLPSLFSSPTSAKADSKASVNARGEIARGTVGRLRGRGKADLLSVKGSSASRTKSPVQIASDPPASAQSETIRSTSSFLVSSTSQSTAVQEDADPWAAWAPASNAVTGEAARKARELATKAGKTVVESNLIKPSSLPPQMSSKDPAPATRNGGHSKPSFEDESISRTPSQRDQEQMAKPKVALGWTVIDTETPATNPTSVSQQPSPHGIVTQVDVAQVHDDLSNLTLGRKQHELDGVTSGKISTMAESEVLVDLADFESPAHTSAPSTQNKHSNTLQQKLASPSSSFACFHSIEDDGMANIPVLKPTSSSSQATPPASQHNGGSSLPARIDTVTVTDDRQILKMKLKDLGYSGTDVTAIGGLLCSLPKSNLRKCIADTAFLKRKAEEASRILQADEEEEEEEL